MFSFSFYATVSLKQLKKVYNRSIFFDNQDLPLYLYTVDIINGLIIYKSYVITH